MSRIVLNANGDTGSSERDLTSLEKRTDHGIVLIAACGSTDSAWTMSCPARALGHRPSAHPPGQRTDCVRTLDDQVAAVLTAWTPRPKSPWW